MGSGQRNDRDEREGGGQNAVDMRRAEVEQLKVGDRLEDRN